MWPFFQLDSEMEAEEQRQWDAVELPFPGLDDGDSEHLRGPKERIDDNCALFFCCSLLHC
jgi:hypothetical protein